ncbi:MAG: ATP-dependent Clp protease ATP-binding subunit [Candidatus Berkelbacteria bacterium]|nr:ATP-dependent Clp protease ATP-binding subunit [Candidatus Berkelbacteria bacterium]
METGPFNKFTKNARLVLTQAQRIAELENRPLSTESILLALIQIPGTLSHDILREYSVNLDQAKLVLSLNRMKIKKPGNDMITQNARSALRIAFRLAADFGHFSIDTEHLLIAVLSSEYFGSYSVIKQVGVDPEQIKDQLTNIFHDLAEMDQMIKKQKMGPKINLEKTQIDQFEEHPFQDIDMGLPPPPFAQDTFTKNKKAIEYFGVDLVEKAKKGETDPVWGREKEIGRAIQILLRRNKNNPVFIGDPGVGKTALVEGLAKLIADDQVPLKLSGKKIIQLDIGLLVAGTMYRGQFEDRLKRILAEVKESKNIILFIDELHSIIGTGSAEGSMDAANLLKPALAKGDIRLIGATTFDEYRKHLEKDTALERRLQTIVVREPTVLETVEILSGLRPLYEKHHGIKINSSAISSAAQLSQKYIFDRFLPDKAIDLIDEASAAKVLKSQNKNQSEKIKEIRKKIELISAEKERMISEEKFEEAAKIRDIESKLSNQEKKILEGEDKTSISTFLNDEDIANLISEITGIPVGNLIEEESKKFMGIEEELSRHIAGQKEAICEVSKSLRRNRSGISSGTKPIGSFIFLGPSGVGKTEVARALAKYIYGHENALVKIDMSEFMERHNAARLVGAPPGYVGYDDAGKLTESVRKNPYSIILFDEIEKAHPDVFNILLQILDEGKLTDAKGRKVDFTNTIIIMTSNIGIEQYRKIAKIGFNLMDESGKSLKSLKNVIEEKLFDVFKPELINRLDKIVIFEPLTKDDLKKIAKIHLNRIAERLTRQCFRISFTDQVINSLVEQNYDPSFGARPLLRAIEEKIENILSDKIIKGEISKKEKVTMEFKGGKYFLE